MTTLNELKERLNGRREFSDGSVIFYKNGNIHREDGPAMIHADGTSYWYQNDQKHREDGPAVVWANGYVQYWKRGQRFEDENFKMKYKF